MATKENKEKKPDIPTVTASSHRPKVPTGTMTELRAIQPPVPALEADDLDIRAYHEQYIDPHVQSASAFIKRSGIDHFMQEHHNASKETRGRKETIPFHAILVAMWLVASTGGNLWMTNIRDVLFHKINDRSRHALGITYPNRPTHPHHQARNDKASDADRRWDEASERAVARTVQRMLRTIDPSVLPKNRNLPYSELLEKARPLTLAEQQELQARLDWVCNRLLETAFKTLPRRIRRKYKGSACIDGTPMRLSSKGRGVENEECSADPDGGFYRRGGDHSETGGFGKSFYALDISLLVAVDCHHGDKQYMPALPLAMTTDRPGVDPAGAARRIFAYIEQAGYPVRWLAGDLLYTDQKAEKFQTAAREIGYKPVLGYGPKHHGLQGTHKTGATMVEGNWFCPHMPEPLVNATVDRRNPDKDQRISHEEWQQRIDQRATYALRGKETRRDDGSQRFGCPASGANPTAACSLKPKSERDRPTKQPDGSVIDARPTINPGKTIGDEHPPVCKQDTITIRPGDKETFDRYWQDLMYGGVQHHTTYVRLRQAQEGVHGFAKAHAAQALDNPQARLVRGKAAQSLFAAFLLAAASVAKIRTFLHTAETDAAGERWVERAPLTSALRTPPGDKDPDAEPDPPPGELPEAA
ncbi:hypothetical protein [Nocardioides xinjiangensis]|uniref:hypothetical protein n=1 Tax=Nocardioides xinjiangensis TaxID=2817376 RepID=UPI001B30EC3A|nr:hypothetical protein [Nocardioides sp. SYSU D00778]